MTGANVTLWAGARQLEQAGPTGRLLVPHVSFYGPGVDIHAQVNSAGEAEGG